MCFVKQITADKYRQCSHGDDNKSPELRVLHHALPKHNLVCDVQARSHTNTTGYYREAGMHTCTFPCERSTVINSKVYFIEKDTASLMESGLVSPDPAEQSHISYSIKPEQRETADSQCDTKVGAFSGQNLAPFDALSVERLAPASQEECLIGSWHDSRRMAARVTITGQNM